MKKAKKRLLIALSIVLAVIFAVCVGFGIYVSGYYRAEEVAISATTSTESVAVKEEDGYLVFRPKTPKAGLVFYPGGLVEYTAYAPLMQALSNEGVLCVLVEMPFHLAVFGMNKADGAIEKYGAEVDGWYIGGHSLGGAMAASYAGNHAEKLKGLLLCAAYSTADLSKTSLEVACVYGSCDRVMNAEKYKECKGNLPDGYEEEVIEGGCHAYFGAYGAQKGDGTPTITREEQVAKTVAFACSVFGW